MRISERVKTIIDFDDGETPAGRANLARILMHAKAIEIDQGKA